MQSLTSHTFILQYLKYLTAVENHFLSFYPYCQQQFVILFLFGRIIVAISRYLAEYFKSLFGIPIILTPLVTDQPPLIYMFLMILSFISGFNYLRIMILYMCMSLCADIRGAPSIHYDNFLDNIECKVVDEHHIEGQEFGVSIIIQFVIMY